MQSQKKSDKNVTSPAADPEIERLRRNIHLSDMEKLSLFTKMLKRNMMYQRATITHK